jgi:hypothetical protein
MSQYRAYFVDLDGHILRPAELIEADTDTQAIEAAKQYLNGHDVELWQGSRPVTLLKHKT